MKKVIFTIIAFFCCALLNAQTLTDSLKACYAFSVNDSFKDGTSATVLSSYNAIHVLGSDRFGSGSAVRFIGGGYLSHGTDSKFNMKKGLTISAWIYIDPALTGEGAIVSKWDNSTGDEYLFGVYSNNKLALALQGKTFELTMLGRSVLPDTTWLHVAMTWEVGGLTNIYVNGLIDTSSYLIDTLVSTSTPLNIGGQGTGMSRYFNGKLDDLRIYSRALSSTEINTLYIKDSACGLKYTAPPATTTSVRHIKELSIFPNPAFDVINIVAPDDCEILMLDSKGSVIKKETLKGKKIMDISDLNTGLYFVKAIFENGHVYISKLIKE